MGDTRRTADERREDGIAAGIVEFAALGLHGASTVTIAARAGISQPCVLWLFGAKKALFLAWLTDSAGASRQEVQQFLAYGMMLTVAASIGAADLADDVLWAQLFVRIPIE